MSNDRYMMRLAIADRVARFENRIENLRQPLPMESGSFFTRKLAELTAAREAAAERPALRQAA